MGKYVELEAVLDIVDRLNVVVDGLIDAGELAAALTALPTQDGEVGRLREALQRIANGDGAYGMQAAEYKAIARAAIAEYRKRR